MLYSQLAHGSFSNTFRVSILMACVLFAAPAQAYQTFFDDAGILKPGEYRVGLSPQIITAGDFSGANINGWFDTNLLEDFELRGTFGFGKVDYHIGALAKWVPIPDYDSQPGFGVQAGLTYARFNGIDVFQIRAAPFVSKELTTDKAGNFTPYAAIPTGITFVSGLDTTIPIQLAIGTHWKPEEMKKTSFSFEVGTNVSKAFSYIAVAGQVAFDEEKGFAIE